jgi:hypothetical protein
LYLEGSPPVEDPWGAMRWGRSPYISPFPWKDFLRRRIRKIEKHKEERDRSGKFKKARWKEWRKENEEIFTFVEVLILMCSASVGNPVELLRLCHPPLRRTHSYGNLPYNFKLSLVLTISPLICLTL